MPIADPGAGAATPAPPLSVKDQEERLRDGEGIISPLTFPEPSVSVGYVEAMASGLRELGTSIADTGNDITGSWAGLSGHYSAPEAETLFSVLDPVATDGDTVGEELDRVAKALEDFAGDVADIKTRWSNLRVEAYDLRSRIDAEGDDWDKGGGFAGFGDSPLKEENDALIERGGKIITDYTEVENTCANAINAGISGRTNFEKQPEGDAELDPNVFYHGFDQDISELAEAWGHENAQTDYGWWVDVSHAVWDFGVDAVQGVGAMVGAHSSEGWFQASWGDALKEYHWDNLTSAASLVGMYDAETDSLGWNGGEGVGEAWKDLAHSVVPWEEWGDRPGYVIGTAALNVIGLVGGAALTATGVGAVVGVPLMAWRGMSIMDGMGGSGRGGSGGGADIDLPQIPDIPRFGGSGSPLINLTGKALDIAGFGPSQWADFKNMVNRLMPAGQPGAEPAGSTSPQTAGETEGGRPGSACPTPASDDVDQRPIQRPVQDPTVADALAFDDIVNHPDNQTFAEQIKNEHRGEISEVDQKAKTRPSNTPDSEEGSWTAEALFDGPDGAGDKVPAMAGADRPGDTMETSAARNTPAPLEQLRLTDIGEPGGNRSLGNEVNEGRGGGNVDLRDRNPTARNHDGDGPNPNPNRDGSSQNEARGIRDDGKPAGSEERSSSRKPIPPVNPSSDVPSARDSSESGEQEPKDHADSEAEKDGNQEHPDNQGKEGIASQGENSDGRAENQEKFLPGAGEKDHTSFAERNGLDTLDGRFAESSRPLPTLDPKNITDATREGRVLGLLPDKMVASRNSIGEITHVLDDGKVKLLEEWQRDLTTRRTQEIVEYRRENTHRRGAMKNQPLISEKALGKKVGAVNAIVVDKINGVVAEGMNGATSSVLEAMDSKDSRPDPKKMHPELQERINSMTITKERAISENRKQYQMYDRNHNPIPEDEGGFSETPHPDKPGRHAEIKAVSSALHLIDELSKSDPSKFRKTEIKNFHADTRFTFKEGRAGLECPFCANCGTILHDAPDPPAGRMSHEKNNPNLVSPEYRRDLLPPEYENR